MKNLEDIENLKDRMDLIDEIHRIRGNSIPNDPGLVNLACDMQNLKDGNVKKSTADYMNELSSDVKQQLYEIFKYYFILFDYDPDDV